MRKSLAPALALAALMSASTVSLAQYTGPRSIPRSTVKQLLDNGTDKREAPDGAGLVTLILCAVLLAVLACGGWVVTR